MKIVFTLLLIVAGFNSFALNDEQAVRAISEDAGYVPAWDGDHEILIEYAALKTSSGAPAQNDWGPCPPGIWRQQEPKEPGWTRTKAGKYLEPHYTFRYNKQMGVKQCMKYR